MRLCRLWSCAGGAGLAARHTMGDIPPQGSLTFSQSRRSEREWARPHRTRNVTLVCELQRAPPQTGRVLERTGAVLRGAGVIRFPAGSQSDLSAIALPSRTCRWTCIGTSLYTHNINPIAHRYTPSAPLKPLSTTGPPEETGKRTRTETRPLSFSARQREGSTRYLADRYF